MTPTDTLVTKARAQLEAAGVPGAARDARALLSAAGLGSATEATDAQRAAFEAAIARRARREPVSHILGTRAFWMHDFLVTADVLDPRPETETLVALARDMGANARDILDLGTGSGCLLLSVLHELPHATGVGSDISPAALAVAARNGERLACDDRVRWIESDWLAVVEGQFDLIVSNPPYIAEAEMADLAPEVRDWEPHLALTPGGDGLAAYRTIARDAPFHLRPGGHLMVEIGPTQAAAVTALYEAAGLVNISTFRDLDGRDRVISGEKPRER